MKFAASLLCCVFILSSCRLFAQSDELATKSQRAKELMAAGKFEEAIPIYSDLVRAVPNNAGVIMNLGLALHMAGHHQKAIAQFERVLKLQRGHLPARLFLGAAYLGLGEPAKSLEPLEKVIQAQPDNPEARAMLADALLTLERFDQAAENFQALTELERDNPKTWNGLGLCYEALAQRNFEELGKIAPGSGYWLELVAESRLKAQQYNSAFYLYRQALAKTPTLRGAHAALGEIYKNTGHPDWAAVERDKERQLPPLNCSGDGDVGAPLVDARGEHKVRPYEKLECDFMPGRYLELIASAKSLARGFSADHRLPTTDYRPPIYYWQSRAYNQLALQAFSHLAQLPPSAEAHELLARIREGQRQYREAAEEWREALKLSPKDSQIEKQLAITLKRTGDNQGAQGLLDELLKREPNSAELNYLLGDTLLSLQQPEKGVPFLEKSLQRNPALLLAHSSLARAYLQIGEAGKAIPHLKAALPIDEDGNLHYQLARAYQASGQQGLAEEMLEKYQQIRKSVEAVRQSTEQEVQITPP